MSIINARYKIITPMFMAGANQRDLAELRPPSFKGVLRFWFRATALPYFNNKLERVKEAEKKLFGSVDTGKARFSLKIEHRIGDNQVVKAGQKWNKHGIAYLGYGVIGRNRFNRQVENTRSYIRQGNTFTVSLILKPDVSDEERLFLKRSLIALGLFGGLGSRSRKGFGSVNLQSLTEDDREAWVAPKTVDEVEDRIKNFIRELGPLSDKMPQYSAFSEHTSVTIVNGNIDPLKLLDEIGKEMLRYRSYGHYSKREGKYILPWKEPALQIFKDDHDLVLKAARGNKPDTHPERVVFGLPHNYRFSTGEYVRIFPENKNENTAQRASPLFIHIHELEDDCVAVLTLLTAQFLPPGERIKIIGRGSHIVNTNVNYNVILDFIKRFPDRIQVYPQK